MQSLHAAFVIPRFSLVARWRRAVVSYEGVRWKSCPSIMGRTLLLGGVRSLFGHSAFEFAAEHSELGAQRIDLLLLAIDHFAQIVVGTFQISDAQLDALHDVVVHMNSSSRQ